MSTLVSKRASLSANKNYGSAPRLAKLTNGCKIPSTGKFQFNTISEDGSRFVFGRRARQLNYIMGGDVIICGPSQRTPYGSLRRVNGLSVTDAGLGLETEQVVLEDVFWAGRVRDTIRISARLLPNPNWVLFAGFRGNIALANRVPIVGTSYALPPFNEKWKVAEGSFVPY